MSAINVIKAVGILIYRKLLCKSHEVHKTTFYYFLNILYILLAIRCNHRNSNIILPRNQVNYSTTRISRVRGNVSRGVITQHEKGHFIGYVGY